MNEGAKRQVLEWFTYGLYAIGVRRGEELNAFTANWVMQASFEPPMVVVAVESDGASLGMMRESGVFSVNVFDATQRKEAARLARPHARAPRKLDELAHQEGVTGAPVLSDAMGYVECRVVGEMPVGDHTLVVGEVVEAGVFDGGEPLTLRSAGFHYAG
ncbi:MAG TPA: flavin reductase family protein [Longimicrobiales bacterium]